VKSSGADVDQEFDDRQERMAQFGESGEIVTIGENKIYDLMEIWCNVKLPGENMPVPVVVEIINRAHVIRIQRNPYWHQQPPFNFMRFIIPPAGEFYGRGLPEASIKLQHQLNSTLDQSMDSATLSLNNITIINPAFAPNVESFEVEPSAIWWADPNAVKQMTFPDLSDIGIKNAGLLRQIITEMSDNSPQLPDPIAGKARSTGQAQLAINEWQTDLFSFMETITVEALNPFAKHVHIMLQQFLDDKRVIRVAGRHSPNWTDRVIMPETLVGNFEFTWQGSLQIENQAIKTQQALNFMRMISTLPPDSGIKIKWANFIRRLLKDGILMRDADHMVETTRQGASTPPDVENQIVQQGGSIDVQDSDDDQAHIGVHQQGIAAIKEPWGKAKLAEHIAKHQEAVTIKQQQAQLQQALLQSQLAQAAPGGAAGNPQQIPEATNEADLARGQGL
jgi:hypothetical protein